MVVVLWEAVVELSVSAVAEAQGDAVPMRDNAALVVVAEESAPIEAGVSPTVLVDHVEVVE